MRSLVLPAPVAAQVRLLMVGAVGELVSIRALTAALVMPAPSDAVTAIVSLVLAGVSAITVAVGTSTATVLAVMSAAVSTCVTVWPPQAKVRV